MWIKVLSESELKVGMCLELRPCMSCKKNHRMILVREVHASGLIYNGRTNEIEISKSLKSFVIIPECYASKSWGFIFAIEDGRLFRYQEEEQQKEKQKIQKKISV